jgi:hypothetical protein
VPLRQNGGVCPPRNDPGDISVFLCNILEANNIKPKRVLKAKNLPTNDLQDAFAIQALFEAAAPYMPETVASDTDASGTDPSSIDSHASDASDDKFTFISISLSVLCGNRTGTVFLFFLSPYVFYVVCNGEG